MKYTLLFILISFSSAVFSQETFQPKPLSTTNKGIVYKDEWSINVKLHTNGLSFGYSWGEIKKYYLTSYYEIEFGFLKHQKEYRQSARSSRLNSITQPLIFGKQNSAMALRFLAGNKRYLSEKARRKGAAVAINYAGGFSLGLLKPYYLDVRVADPDGGNTVESMKYSKENEEIFLFPPNIEGSSGFFKGIGETKFVPGLHGKAGVIFSWGAYENFVRALEGGVMLDIYAKNLDIMILEENKPYFINLYITLQLGRRK